MAAELGATTSRLLNRLAYDIANVASDIAGGAVNSDYILVADASADGQVKKATPLALQVGSASGRVVSTTVTTLGLTVTEHGERLLIVNTNSTVANTFTLPAATGSGVKFTIINGIAQTQGSVVIAANGTDIMKGRCLSLDSTAVATAASFFVTTATSDKVTWNRTTTGGIGQDTCECWDEAANTWRVMVVNNCAGAKATPFSET
jgi:hypothetical protein